MTRRANSGSEITTESGQGSGQSVGYNTARLVVFARALNIPAPGAEMEEEQPKLAQARRRARHAFEG